MHLGSKSIPEVIRDFACSGATENSATIYDLLRTSLGVRIIFVGHVLCWDHVCGFAIVDP